MVTPTTERTTRRLGYRTLRPTRLMRAPEAAAAPVPDRVVASRPPGAPADPLVALGVRIDRVDVATALARVEELVRRPGCARIAFVNAHSLNLSCDHPGYRAALSRTDLVLNDGAGVALLGRALGAPFLANLNGTDFVPQVLETIGTEHSVFLYGGRPGVAASAADRLRRQHPGLRVAGCLDGYAHDAAVAAEAVRRSGAGVVLVALGNPRQELWVQQWGEYTGVRLAVSVGAFLDFAAGEVVRAPAVVRALRLEWAFRLAQEPRRLARRYLVGIPVFLLRVARAWWGSEVGERATVLTYDYPPQALGGLC
ncbi:WecB/TagA/CpsF family glycosyltransferase [Jatrophihabitans sp. YIM 134969]